MSSLTQPQLRKSDSAGSSTYPDPRDTRSRIVELLSATANGCLAELGYFPSMPKLLQELEQRNLKWQTENVKLFEDNRRLLEMVNTLNQRPSLSNTPNSDLVNIIASLQAELRIVRTQRDELIQRHGDSSQPGHLPYAHLQAEYNTAVEAYRSAMSEINRLQAHNISLCAHFQQCPYALQASRSSDTHPQHPQQSRAISPNAVPLPAQLNMTSPTSPQLHSTSVNASQNVARQRPQSQSSRPRTMQAQHGTNQSQNHLYQQRSQSLQTPSSLIVGERPVQNIVPAQAQFQLSTIRPQNGNPQQFILPQPTTVPVMKFQQAMSIVSAWDPQPGVSSSSQPSQVAQRAQLLVASAVSGGQPIVNLVGSNTTSSRQPTLSLNTSSTASSLQSNPGLGFEPTLQNMNLSTAVSLRAPSPMQLRDPILSTRSASSIPEKQLTTETLTVAPQDTHPIVSSSQHDPPRDSEMPDLSMSPPSSSRKSSPPETHEILTPVASRSGSEAVHIVSSPVLDHGLNPAKRSNAEMSGRGQGPELGEPRKKPRLSCGDLSHLAPTGSNVGSVESSHPSGDDEEEDEEDVVDIGPDGLRLVSDCLASIFSASGDLKSCLLCKSRFSMGYASEEPKPFENATDGILVDHCEREHEQVWNNLRHDV